MKVYDDGEGHCPGDPVLTEENLDRVKTLQEQIDYIQKVENPMNKAAIVKAWKEGLDG